MQKQIFTTMLFLAVAMSLANAQVVGTSKLTLPSNIIYVHQGNSTNVNATVSLVNGTASGSTLIAVNAKNLSAKGITVYIPNGYGVPPYNSRMTISANSTTPVGNYTLVLYESGNNQAKNYTNATIAVLSPTTPIPVSSVSTTVPTSTVPSNASTSAPTTVQSTPHSGIPAGQEYMYLLAAVIVIIAIIIIAVVAYYSKHRF